MYLHYAKPYLPFALPVTLICWWLVYAKGPATFGALLFLKLLTMAIGWVVLRKRHRQDIFFYQNIGYGEPRMMAVAGTVDGLLWLLGITLLIVIFY